MFMLHRRGTATDRLLNVIQVLQLGKKTGHLVVERDTNSQQEEGEVVFDNGQIVQAYAGNLQGQEALSWLSTWTHCRFLFVAETMGKITRPLNTGPLPSLPGPEGARSLRDTQPRLPSASPATRQETGGIQQILPTAHANPRRTCPTEKGFHLLERAGLSRSHRHLFLLVDGQRPIAELVRLTGRPPEEVQRLLHDLESIGVIQ
jgi:Domain of unknown function (DUF4388)